MSILTTKDDEVEALRRQFPLQSATQALRKAIDVVLRSRAQISI